MNKFLCIVQARLTSSRLPNKVLKKVLNNTIIEIINSRLLKSKSLDQIIYAIPDNTKNQYLAKYLKEKNFITFLGSEENVLKRFYFAAKKFKAKHILRVTSDCPFVDPQMIDKMYNIFKKKKVDYMSNTQPATFPDGLDLEIFTFRALKLAYKYSILEDEKEHVTPYLRNSPIIKRYNFLNKENLERFNISLNTLNDYKNIKRIFLYGKNIFIKKNKIFKFLKHNEDRYNFSNFKNKKKNLEKKITNETWEQAKKVIPEGNNFLSKRINIEIFKSWPAYYTRAKGCYVWDLDSNKYTDVSLMGVGTNVLGYNNININKAVKNKIDLSNMSSLNCPEEVKLAQKLIEIHPWASKVRFARTGGEANAIAVRIARAFTNSEKIAVCGYHGWHDWYLAANLNDPTSLKNHLMKDLKTSGVPKVLSNTVYAFEYNDFEGMKKIVEKEKIKIIKMEVERLEKPKNNFLEKIRRYTKENKIVLIFDECTTGFREEFGGLHKKYKVNPDIAVFGKAIANGFSLTAIVGIDEIMSKTKNSFISSTFWSERIGYVAALKTIEFMKKNKINKKINKIGIKIKKNWSNIFKKNNIPVRVYGPNVLPTFQITDLKKYNLITFITKKMLEKKFLFKNIVYVSIAHKKIILKQYFNELQKIVNEIADIYSNKKL